MFRILLACVFAACSVAQPPLIYNRSVFNAASYMPAGVPSGAIARGSIFSLFGERLGPSQPATANSFPLGTSLSSIAINVIQGNTSVSAIPLYVSGSQINAIMPSNAPLGMASIQVVVGNFRSNMAPVRIANSAFGIFTALGTGVGPGILQNFIAADNQPINSPTITAQNGQVITLWGTGLGPVTGGDNVAPKAGNLPTKVDVFVGGVPATLLYSGRTPCCAGTDQIVFKIPDNAPTGCWVPVYVRTEGTIVSNFVTLAINPASGVCTTDVLPQHTSLIVSGNGTFGTTAAVRATTRHDVGVRAPVDVTADYHAVLGVRTKGGPFPFNPTLAFPPAGTCTVYTLQGDLLNGDILPGTLPSMPPLDFGPALLLTGPHGPRTLSNLTNIGFNYLGGAITNGILPSSLFLDPGSYTISGMGGTDIAGFSASYTIPQPLAWTNRDQLSVVNRAQPLTLSWSGADSSQVIAIVGFGEDLPTNSSVSFACVAPRGAGSFTVPPDILSNLPPTRANPLQSKDVIYLVTVPPASIQNLNAKGLDQGTSDFLQINGKTVVLQ